MRKIKHKNTFFLLITLILMSLFFYVIISKNNEENRSPEAIEKSEELLQKPKENFVPSENMQSSSEILGKPLDRVAERVNKKPFGIFVSPKKSPVNPERFSGYHTAIDLEIFPEESGRELIVRSVCSGKMVSKREADGYGGVIVQACEIEGNSVTIIYGHMKLSSVSKKQEDELSRGDEIGLLGDAYSFETDGERKHLHLGIHKGTSINIAGYVQKKEDLLMWLDPCEFFCE